MLVDGHVVRAGFGYLTVVGDHHHALGAGILDSPVERGRRDRIDDDRFCTGLHHRVDLLDLLLSIGPCYLNFQVDLVA